MRLFISFLLAMSTCAVQAQVWFAPQPLVVQGLPAGLATAGGFSSPQFSLADLDQDGSPDLVVFDRNTAQWQVFVRQGQGQTQTWAAAPDLATLLPPCRNWALLRDYDRDGRADIFTDNRGSVALFKNVADPAGHPFFELVSQELVSTSLGGGALALSVTSTDIPGIADIDGDGDLDVLTFDGSGVVVDQHRNVAPARAIPTFQKSTCWGKFSESGSTCNLYTLGLACRVGVENEPTRPAPLPNRVLGALHQGSTVLPLDADGDGDLDVLMGDVVCKDQSLLTNGAAAGQPPSMANHTAPWPQAGRPANFLLFPAAYALDFDGTGRPSLVLAQNGYGPSNLVGPNQRRGVALYTDAATTGPPAYTYRTDAFLHGDMIDWGADAVPAWLDIDADGDPDLVLGSTYRPTQNGLSAGLVLYKNNAGTLTRADTNLGGYLANQGRYCHPFAADLNADGRTDLGVLLPATNNKPTALLIPMGAAQGPDGTALSFAQQDTLRFAFAAGDAPAFADTDSDGDLDMVLGRDDGSLCLVPNTGTPQAPAWGQLQRGFLGYDVNTTFGCKVAVADVDGNTFPDVLVATGTTPLRLYKNPLFVSGFRAVPDTLLHQNNTLGRASMLASSFWVAPTLADIDGDAKPDLTIGTGQGGVYFYQNQTGKPLAAGPLRPALPAPRLLANPAPALHLWLPAAATVSVSDALGRELWAQEVLAKDLTASELSASGMPTGGRVWAGKAALPGVYCVRIYCQKQLYTLRWVAP